MLRSNTKNSVSKSLGIWTFILLLIFKGIFLKPADALTTLDKCATDPECVAAVGSELAPVVSAPTGVGYGASTLSTTTSVGSTSVFVRSATGVAIVIGGAAGGYAIWQHWSQAQNEQVQNKAKQKYCATYPSDAVCGFAWDVTGQGMANGLPNCEPSGFFYPRILYATDISFSDSTFNADEFYGYYQGCAKDVVVLDGQLSPDNFFAGGTGTATKISDPPQWKDWPQEKRDEAVRLLNPSDWQNFITSMPEGGRLKPGDKVNAPTIIIPGQETDDPNTPADERLLRKVPGFFTYPGLPNRDFDRDGFPDSADPAPQNPSIPIASSTPPEATPEPTPEPYVNDNPSATPDEVRVGEFLDQKAQAGEIPRAVRVRGAAEMPNTRSGDYRFIDSNGNEISADLYQPQSSSPGSIVLNTMAKGNQAEVVAIELGLGYSGQIDAATARRIAEDVINTPDHGVNRVIVIKDGQIIVDHSR